MLVLRNPLPENNVEDLNVAANVEDNSTEQGEEQEISEVDALRNNCKEFISW